MNRERGMHREAVKGRETDEEEEEEAADRELKYDLPGWSNAIETEERRTGGREKKNINEANASNDNIFARMIDRA